MRKTGKFIIIEGIDGSGKTTQFNLLRARLKKEKVQFNTADFPRYYKSTWGEMAGGLLTNKYGKLKEIDPHLFVLPFMIDEYTWGRDIGKQQLQNGFNIISNRYFTSNVHQVAKLKTNAKKKFRDWLWKTGYKDLGMVKPDLVIFINVPPDIAYQLNKKKVKRGYLKGKQSDSAEKDFLHQKAAYKEYMYMVEHNRSWVKVDCVLRGVISSPNQIHEMVWKIVSKIL